MADNTDNSLKSRLIAVREAAIENFMANPHPQRLLKTLCRNVDSVLIEAWHKTGLATEHVLIAVGGYGRGELYPHSDVDVLILLDKAPDSILQKKLESLVQLFWTLGVTIGHSVRTIEECLEESAHDITVQTSLLEARYITGNRRLFRRMKERYAAQIYSRSLSLIHI